MSTVMQTPAIEPDILDLFAGPGGRDRGAELAGIDPRRIKGIELDEQRCRRPALPDTTGFTATSWT